MKPFDLEAAKRGEKLVTRNGRAVTEFHHFETIRGLYPFIAVIDGERRAFTTGGHFNSGGHLHDNDLFMAPKKRTVYVNVYDHPGDVAAVDGQKGTKAYAFNEEGSAIDNSKGNSWGLLAVAHPIEIEE